MNAFEKCFEKERPNFGYVDVKADYIAHKEYPQGSDQVQEMVWTNVSIKEEEKKIP